VKGHTLAASCSLFALRTWRATMSSVVGGVFASAGPQADSSQWGDGDEVDARLLLWRPEGDEDEMMRVHLGDLQDGMRRRIRMGCLNSRAR